jgi:hypothetical protein
MNAYWLPEVRIGTADPNAKDFGWIAKAAAIAAIACAPVFNT